MKMTTLLLGALLFAATLACSPRQEPEDVPPPPTAPEQSKESAKEVIEGYGEALTGSMDKARGTQAKLDMAELQRAVQEYSAEHGEYPPSLEDAKGYLTTELDLSPFAYNPATGKVSLK